MVSIITWNVNGFRSIMEKGCLPDILEKNYDIICLQEVKISTMDIIRKNVPSSYNIYGNAPLRGRNGVVVLSKQMARSIDYTIGHDDFDKQGRFLCVHYSGFSVVNLYMPHGGRDKAKLPFKLEAGKTLISKLEYFANDNVIIATDLNIARNDIDVSRAEQNHNNIMFTSAERKICNDIISIGYKDVFRERNPSSKEYSWWSYAFECRKRNIGWRIDYFFVSEKLMPQVSDIRILRDQIGSDHCPILLEVSLERFN